MKGESALSVFMPFYNEEELVRDSVKECHAHLKTLGREFELLLVDDGSTDSTPAKIDRLEENLEEVRAIHHTQNQGYGRALATGFSETRFPLVFYTDGDMQFDISQLEQFLDELEENDMVVGYRENRKDGLGREVASGLFNRLARLILPVKEKDIDCGFKLVKREVLEEIELETERTVDAELLSKARSEGREIEQLPVEHQARSAGESEAEGLLGVRPGLVYKSLRELFIIRRDLD